MKSDYLFFQGIKERPSTRRLPRQYLFSRRPEPDSDSADAFFEELFHRAGLSAKAYRGSALKRRTQACLRFLRAPDLETARHRLKERPELVDDAVDVVLLGVTEFFRDAHVFNFLRQKIVPNLRHLRRPSRVWSAACSDGRELCSIAILLQEAGVTDADLLGTDCRAEAIGMAQKGEFPLDALGKMEPWGKIYFVSMRNHIRLTESLENRLKWKKANLLTGVEPGPWDMILWRNMAIYLKLEKADQVWNNLICELASGGYLISGKADHPPSHAALEKIAPCIYRKK